MFKMLDTDNSKSIGNEELRKALISYGLKINGNEIDELIKEVFFKLKNKFKIKFLMKR